MTANIDAMPAGDRLRAPVGRFAGMPVACAGRVYLGADAGPLCFLAKGGFGERRAADIAKANEEDSKLSSHSHSCSRGGQFWHHLAFPAKPSAPILAMLRSARPKAIQKTHKSLAIC
jgi:hypothetical protein